LAGVPKTCRVLDSQVRRPRPAALRGGEQLGRSRLLNEKHLLGSQRFASADAATLGLSGNLRGQDAGGMERAGVRDRLGRTAMPAYVSAVGFSLTQAWSRNWASRSGTAEGAKNSKVCGKMPAVYHWATDEVHFEQRGSRCRMWVRPSTKDPVLLHATLRCRMFAGWKVSVLLGTG